VDYFGNDKYKPVHDPSLLDYERVECVLWCLCNCLGSHQNTLQLPAMEICSAQSANQGKFLTSAPSLSICTR
jgi:hypothetical protein